MWQPNDRLRHRFNRDLGPGRVVAVEGRNVVVHFPDGGEMLRLAIGSDALEPLVLDAGSRARLEESGETVTVAARLDDGRYRLEDGRELGLEALWPLGEPPSPADRLLRGKIDAFQDVRNRLDGLRLARLRQADGLGSFLGGRIRLFPHQLYAAEKACQADPVRWLLADEVGLGKTVEACLIMNRLLHTGRAARTLVVAPATLTVQWLGELWRKHHRAFVLLDDKRLRDVARDHGAGFNPFEVHPHAIVALETLVEQPQLSEQAVAAGIDLLVVDEAHHLRRPPGHPGQPAYRRVAPIAALGRNLLLLSATPLEDDAHGFFRLLQLLRPDQLPEDTAFERRLARNEPLPPCTSATRRRDIGGLPPRVPAPAVGIPEQAWAPLEALIEWLRAQPAAGAAARRKKAERIARALSSPAAVASRLDHDPQAMRLLAAARDADPRVAWLQEAVRGWQRGGEKTLIFVAHRQTLEALKRAFSARGLRAGIFHQDLSPERRDIEAAQLRLPEGPPVLISTECGGEGRNFEHCRRLVLFDLPWQPAAVEQRIGRLDRIGRTLPTEIVYFLPAAGLGRAIARLYQKIGLFTAPLGGLERALREVAGAIRDAALDGDRPIAEDAFAAVLDDARAARDRVHTAAYHELYRDPYRGALAAGILRRVPAELETLTADVVLRAAARLGLGIEQTRGDGVWLIELGGETLVDHLPGVPAGSRYLGTFDRALAVADETLEFFASGHPLVEGVLAELEDGPRGRVGLAQIEGDESLFGLLAVYREQDGFRAVAVDQRGRPRPDLATRLSARPLSSERLDAGAWTRQRAWRPTVARMIGALGEGTPDMVVAFRVRPPRAGGGRRE